MISSRADFLFFSARESELEDASFFLVDAAALRVLLLRAELQEVTNSQTTVVCHSCQIFRSVCTWAWRGRRHSTRRPD